MTEADQATVIENWRRFFAAEPTQRTADVAYALLRAAAEHLERFSGPEWVWETLYEMADDIQTTENERAG